MKTITSMLLPLTRRLLGFVSAVFAAMMVIGCETFIPALPAARQIDLDADNIVSDDNVVVLVRSEQAANALVINAARRNYQLKQRYQLDGLSLIMLDFLRPAGVSGAIAIADMEGMEKSATAGLDHFYTLQQTGNEYSIDRKQYAQSMVNWPAGGCMAPYAIGMIDGDLDDRDPMLANATIIKRSFARGEPKDIDHGTAIANLLVGPGRLNGARLYSASVISDARGPASLDPTPGTGVPEIIQALNWLQQSGVSVVNISLAGPYNKLLDRAIQRAASSGMLIIAAVGNDGPDAGPRYPAALKTVIAVTAVDIEQNVFAKAVRGDHVDFSAPGVDVFVGSAATGKYITGTSVAAPFVTALVAASNDAKQKRTIQDVRNYLARQSADLGSAGPDPIFGRGLVQANATCGQ
ncbi:MAG: S8 family serine peptidase [Pseudomonadota bacterium]